jgi:hypothetical protein
VVALWRWRSSKAIQFPKNHIALAADADLDMRRPAPRHSAFVLNLGRMLRWMMPQGKTIGPPMRSIAREIEEAFPSDKN